MIRSMFSGLNNTKGFLQQISGRFTLFDTSFKSFSRLNLVSSSFRKKICRFYLLSLASTHAKEIIIQKKKT